MINLIGPERKKHFLAARRNVIWRRYITLLTAVLIAIIAVIGGAGLLLFSQIDASKQHVADNELKRDKQYRTIKKEAEDFRSNLANAKIILGAETSYSDIITKFAQSITPGCVLLNIQLSEQGLTGPQSFSFKCKSNDNIVPLKLALEGSSLFSDVSIVSTTSKPESSKTIDPYLVDVTIAAKINKPSQTISATATQSGVQ